MSRCVLSIWVVVACLTASPPTQRSAGAEARPTGQAAAECKAAESNCGVLSLCAVLRFLGSDAALPDVARAVVSRRKGFSLLALQEAAEDLGFFAYAVRLTPEDLCDLPWPAITYMNDLYSSSREKHFVAVIGRNMDDLLILDLPSKAAYFPMAYFTEYWDGEALVVTRQPVEPASLMPQAVRNARAGGPSFDYGRAGLIVLGVLSLLASAVFLYRGLAGARRKSVSTKA